MLLLTAVVVSADLRHELKNEKSIFACANIAPVAVVAAIVVFVGAGDKTVIVQTAFNIVLSGFIIVCFRQLFCGFRTLLCFEVFPCSRGFYTYSFCFSSCCILTDRFYQPYLVVLFLVFRSICL